MNPIQAIALFTVGIIIGIGFGIGFETSAIRKELIKAGLGSYTVDTYGTVTFKLKGQP